VTIRAEYDRAAADYDRRWARYNRASLALLRPWIEGRDLGRVVDVGCGTGNLLPLLMDSAGRMDGCVGVDLSPEMLRMARGKARGGAGEAGFVAADAARLPLRVASFDTAVSASVLHYWDDARSGLAEIRRVLRPGGRLLLLDWSRDRPGMWLMNAYLRARGEHYPHMYSRAEARDAVRAAGFQVEGARSASAGWPWHLFVITARKR
jgi:ubiquinone/menaquinone biosynthesis C-methylase UbiE